MIAYVDSSVVLRIVLGQRDRLAQWREITHGVACGLVEVECLRTIDRLRVSGAMGTLDAIHLATAEMWREVVGKEAVMATHDQALALAARSSGSRVIGV